jgi:hypothetical protein
MTAPKAPNPKLQVPNKIQNPNFQVSPMRYPVLEFHVWSFSEAWMLEFGAYAQACRVSAVS